MALMASETLRSVNIGRLSTPGRRLIENAWRDIGAAADAIARAAAGEASLRVRADALGEVAADMAADGPARACLVLPADVALTQRFMIPRAGAKHLAGIVQNKIRQLTPFEPDEVCAGWRRAPGGKGDLAVDLVVAPRQACEAALSAARARNLVVDRLEAEGAPGVDILPAPERGKAPAGRRTRRLVRANLFLLAALGVVVFGGGGLRYATASLRAAHAAERADAVISARREAQRIAAGSADLQAVAAGAPDIARLLNALAGALDDGAYLDRAAVDREEILIEGFSDNAADVLFAVDESPFFRDAAFQSAIKRNPETGRERFQIRAELERAP